MQLPQGSEAKHWSRDELSTEQHSSSTRPRGPIMPAWIDCAIHAFHPRAGADGHTPGRFHLVKVPSPRAGGWRLKG